MGASSGVLGGRVQRRERLRIERAEGVQQAGDDQGVQVVVAGRLEQGDARAEGVSDGDHVAEAGEARRALAQGGHHLVHGLDVALHRHLFGGRMLARAGAGAVEGKDGVARVDRVPGVVEGSGGRPVAAVVGEPRQQELHRVGRVTGREEQFRPEPPGGVGGVRRGHVEADGAHTDGCPSAVRGRLPGMGWADGVTGP